MTTHPDFQSLTVEQVLHRWPRTSRVFIRHRMACVGCTMAPFETLPEAADHYRLPPDDFVAEIRGAAGQHPPEDHDVEPWPCHSPPQRSPKTAPSGGGTGGSSP